MPPDPSIKSKQSLFSISFFQNLNKRKENTVFSANPPPKRISGKTMTKVNNTTPVPFIKHWNPLFGFGAAFKKNAGELLLQLQQEHGDVFSIMLGRRKFTFVLNPHDYPTILKDTENLSSERVGKEVSTRAFGIDYSTCPDDMHDFSRMLSQAMQKNRIRLATEEMYKNLKQEISAIPAHHAQEDSLFRFIAELIFNAGGKAMFGSEIYQEDNLFEDFLAYDIKFPWYVAGLSKRWFFPKQHKYVQGIAKILETPRQEEQSDAILSYYTKMEAANIPRDVQGRIIYGLLWATQSNTVVMAFHSILYILKDKTAQQALLSEIETVLKNHNTSLANFPIAALNELTLLDACLDEVLRLKTFSMPTREVINPLSVNFENGKVLQATEGEMIALYPLTTHMNPDIYPEPNKFIWDRFVGKQGNGKMQYQGKKLQYNLLPFGGGASICPGRHFAKNEFKLLTAVLLTQFDIELLSDALPDIDQSRAGLGARAPLNDIPIRIKRKESHLTNNLTETRNTASLA